MPGDATVLRDFSDDDQLVGALRRGDETAFVWLLEQYEGPLRRIARGYVPTDAAADDVVQETWIAVLRGVDRFEQRSTFRTWMYHILLNIARSRGVKEHRTLPFSSALGSLDGADPTIDADRFLPPDHERWPGHWASFPNPWEHEPESRLLSRETVDVVAASVAQRPPAQREVLTLRDVEGWSSVEVCNALDISETNQRVLLHRARSKVRRALELYFEGALAI